MFEIVRSMMKIRKGVNGAYIFMTHLAVQTALTCIYRSIISQDMFINNYYIYTISL